MKMKDLVTEFNALIDATGQGAMNHVKRFSTIAAGQKRLEQLREKHLATDSLDTPTVPADTNTAPTDPPEAEKTPAPAPKAPTVNAGTKARDEAAAGKKRPSVDCMHVKFTMVTDDPATTRKAYIEACVALGYKKSTAGRQWAFDMEYLTKRFGA